MRGGYSPFIGQPQERPLSDRLRVKAPALSILPMIAFRDALCITHNPVNGTVSQGREGPARVAGCHITPRTPVGIIRKAASWRLCRYRHDFHGGGIKLHSSGNRTCCESLPVMWLQVNWNVNMGQER